MKIETTSTGIDDRQIQTIVVNCFCLSKTTARTGDAVNNETAAHRKSDQT